MEELFRNLQAMIWEINFPAITSKRIEELKNYYTHNVEHAMWHVWIRMGYIKSRSRIPLSANNQVAIAIHVYAYEEKHNSTNERPTSTEVIYKAGQRHANRKCPFTLKFK